MESNSLHRKQQMPAGLWQSETDKWPHPAALVQIGHKVVALVSLAAHIQPLHPLR